MQNVAHSMIIAEAESSKSC